MSKQIVTLDSSQLDAFLTCPRQWHYGYRRRLSSISGPPKTAMVMGTYIHHLLDQYYKARARGESINQARDAGMAFDPDKSTNCRNCGKPLDQHKSNDDYSKMECILPPANDPLLELDDPIFFDPIPFPLDKKERDIVRLRFIDYVMTYSAQDFIPLSEDTVEVGFSEAIYEDDDFLFVLEGKIDLIAKYQMYDKIVVDHKSQGQARDLYDRSIQFKNYAMITGTNTLVINYIRFNKNPTPDTYKRVIVPFSKPQHDQWKNYVIAVFKKVAKAIQDADQDPNYWLKSASDPRWSSCSGKYGECQYTGICEEPGLAEQKIRNLYHIKEEWKPW